MRVAGVDEAGRGPLAGPVVAAAVIFPAGYRNQSIRDSKQLTAKKRQQLIHQIKRDALAWSIISVGPRRIERMNIREATKQAMSLAIHKVAPDFARVDGNMTLGIGIPHEAIVKGDQKHVDIAAASILAKVYRDQLMETLDRKYPGYGLCDHNGYPTAGHRAAIVRLGPARIHRLTFRGVKENTSSTTVAITRQLLRLGLLQQETDSE